MSSNKSYKACLEVLHYTRHNANDLLLEIAKIAPATVVRASKILAAKLNPVPMTVNKAVKLNPVPMTVNKAVDALGPDNCCLVGKLIANGEKILAVRLIREKLGLGLKEAKDIVDAW